MTMGARRILRDSRVTGRAAKGGMTRYRTACCAADKGGDDRGGLVAAEGEVWDVEITAA